MPRVESRFDRREREGTSVGNFKGVSASCLFQLRIGHYLVDQPDLLCLRSRHLRIAEPDVFGALLADQIFEVPRSVPRIEAAHHRTNLTKHCALLRDSYVADHLQ